MLRAGRRDGREETTIDAATIRQVQAAMRAGRAAQARALLQQALAANPGDLDALQAMAGVCAALGDADGAVAAFRKLARLAPEPLPLINEMARFCLQQGRLEDAVHAYERFLSRHPESASAQFNCGYYLGRLGKPQQAIDRYLKALRLGIDRPEEVHLNIANLYAESLRDDARALSHLERALAINPRYGGALHNLGNLAEQQGRLDDARDLFRRAIDADPGNVSPLARLADTYDFSQGQDALFGELSAAASKTADPDVHFALGRALEQRGNFAGAWQQYSLANQADRRQLPPYDRAAWEQRVARIIAACTPEWLARLRQQADWAPVFICGLFRSGSTLVEQVLAAHPAFRPAGEREFFPRLVASHLPRYPEGLEKLNARQLRGWASRYRREMTDVFGRDARLTDKRPDNFLFAGLIKAMFGQARIVITRRDWRDVAVSLYATRLGPAAAYATDLGDIRHYIGLHDQLADHWRALLGDDLVEVSYESLVADLRAEAGRLLASLGEPWDERCLAFHELRNTVRTASVWQVRQPLYSGSVGRWHRFEEPFVAAFGEAALAGPHTMSRHA